VLRVFGASILNRLMLSVSTDLTAFNRRIAAARGTARNLDWMAPVIQRATRHASAARESSASDPALALRHAAHAFDLLAGLPR
jgi:hypothetical protein